MTTVTYQFGGYDGGNSGMTEILFDGKVFGKVITPSSGINSSWQENELYRVNEYAILHLGIGNFILPYCVDQSSGYVYKNEKVFKAMFTF